jgi:beta-glucanase (GH16 family)
VRPYVGAIAFQQNFDRPASPAQFRAAYPELKTQFYFGNQGDMTSRVYPGTMNVMLDGQFASTAMSPLTRGGQLEITAYQLTPPELALYGLNGKRSYGSAVVSTENSFSQTYGYFEISAKLPDVPGTWPAFWLLPFRTPGNDGRLPEVDIFEHFGGPLTVLSQGKPVVIDRVGKPVSTLHYGTRGAEKKFSNNLSLPAKIDLSKFHTFGFLWTPDEMRFFIDQVQTLVCPNPGVSDPHYIVLSMDVAAHAGDAATGKYPASFLVDYVRAWPLKQR